MDFKEKNKVQSSTLYLVATPIGNLADISERAKKILSEVDFVAAEDTRNSMKLLNCLDIKNELISYHEHNKKSSGSIIVSRLLGGQSCALITDAGMPAISDPGEDIVKMCVEAGICVSVVPGACAAVSALSVSGLCTRRFVFEGFLPAVKAERRTRLLQISKEERTVILYEAPHKLRSTLDELIKHFGGERKIALCRELTKINEEIIRTTLSSASDMYKITEPRGEYVIVIDGYTPAAPKALPADQASLEKLISDYTNLGMTRMEAVKSVAKDLGVPKSEIYNIVMKKQ